MKISTVAMVVSFSMAGTLAQAQSSPDTIGMAALNNRIDDIQYNIGRNLATGQDPNRFSNPEFRPGLSGSASLGYTGQSGNTKSQDFTAGARLRFAQGALVQTIGLAADYAENNSVKTKENLFAVYDANYYINDRVYGFILGRVQTDGLATAANETATDAFLGFGPGYRILNTEQITWRLQAGIGQSYLKDGTGNSNSEFGVIASSRLYYAFNPNVFLTNDTDVLKTHSTWRINNDFGINFKMTDVLATRISYLTEYNDSRAIRADNQVGVSLVYGF